MARRWLAKGLREERNRKIFELRQEGLSYDEIAERFGLSPKTIPGILIRENAKHSKQDNQDRAH